MLAPGLYIIAFIITLLLDMSFLCVTKRPSSAAPYVIRQGLGNHVGLA